MMLLSNNEAVDLSDIQAAMHGVDRFLRVSTYVFLSQI